MQTVQYNLQFKKDITVPPNIKFYNDSLDFEEQNNKVSNC